MKKIMLALAVLMTCAASCGKTGEQVCVPDSELTVNICNEFTRASVAATPAETALDLSKVFLLVFRSDGSRELAQSVTLSSGAVTVNLSAGTKTVWVVANGPSSVLGVGSLADFKAMVSSLSDNSPNFVMAGGATKTISGKDSVSIILKRLAAKIALVNICRDYSDMNYASSSLVVNRVYLSNVAAVCHYWSDSETSTVVGASSVPKWYNPLGVYDLGSGDPAALLSVPLNISLGNGSSYPGSAGEPVMYAYPSLGPACPKLVVDCSLAGTQGYYSVSLPAMESNKIYNVSLTLKKKPSDNPEDNVPEIDPALSFSANVSVADWDAPVSIVETI